MTTTPPLTARFLCSGRMGSTWLVPSRSKPGWDHTANVLSDERGGDIQCSCPRYIFGHQQCAHIDAVLAAMKKPIDTLDTI